MVETDPSVAEQVCAFRNFFISRVGQNQIHTVYVGIYDFLAGKSPNVRPYMVHIYGSGQPYYLDLCRTYTLIPHRA